MTRSRMTWSLTSAVGTLSMVLAHCVGCHLAAFTASSPAGHAAHAGHASAHGLQRHLLPVASGAFVLGVVVLLCAAVLAHRHHRSPRLRLGRVLFVQLVAFVVIQVVQLLFAGVHDAALLANESLLTLLLQPSIAIAVFWICRRAIRVVGRLFERQRSSPRRRAPAIQPTPSTCHRPASLHWALTAARRGPPVAAIGLI